MLLERWNAALEASERRIKLDPYNPNAYNEHGARLSLMGHPEQALPLTEKAAALSRSYSTQTLLVACEAHLLLGAAEKAVAACERASARPYSVFYTYALLAAAYANAGHIAQGRIALQEVLKAVPGTTVEQLRAKHYSDHPEYQKLAETYWYEGLRKAGLAEK